ncbi:SDR family oxidoreductase [Marinimicrobium sp. C2-29]|uniref:SDR family oxidoreductase n=1 Tax=Marinimicrobium sp. C2-29 TaxID=3139825 RepID=UPI003139223B
MIDNPKVALVTGAAQGIGRGIVHCLLERNWRVVLFDIDEAAGQQYLEQLAEGRAATFIAGDVANEADVRRCLEQTLEWGGRLDALVNNAGLADPHSGPVEELALADWQRRLDVNLTGPFLMAKHAVPALRATRGAIVNISSTRAWQSEPQCESYAASKGGVVALTHALAMSLGPDVRVNSISPGWIDVRAQQADAPDNLKPLPDNAHAQHPAGRVGKAEDIGSLAAYLASSEAAFITGQDFIVDGGMTRKMIYN